MDAPPSRSLFRQPLFLLILLLLLTAALLITPHDRDWTLFLRAHRLAGFTNFFSRTLFQGDLPGAGDISVFGLLLVLIAYLRVHGRSFTATLQAWRIDLGFILISAVVSAVEFVHVTKWVVGRARPSEVISKGLAYTDWFQFGPHFISQGAYRGSFPSGHTAAAVALIAVAYALAGDPARPPLRRCIGWLVGLLAVVNAGAMAVARAMASSHWLSDAVLSLLLTWLLIHLLYYRVLWVPQRQARLRRSGAAEALPRWWELRFVGWSLAAAVGLMCLLLGGRAPLAGAPAYLLLAPVGLLLLGWAAPPLRRLCRDVRRQGVPVR